MISYDAALQSIYDYYGTGSTIWNKIQTGGASWDEISFALSQIPQLQLDKSISGYNLGFGYADPVYITPSQVEDILNYNSNYTGGQYSGNNSFTAKIPANFSNDGGNINITGGSLNGLGQTVATIADRAALGVTGVNIGAKLGKAIDSAIYNLDPEWWDNHYPNINPETWVNIAGQNELGQSFIRTLFDIKPTGTTAYIDERVIAQTYQMLRDLGVWEPSYTPVYTDIDTLHVDEYINNSDFTFMTVEQFVTSVVGIPLSENMKSYYEENKNKIGIITSSNHYPNQLAIAHTYLDDTDISITSNGPYKILNKSVDRMEIEPLTYNTQINRTFYYDYSDNKWYVAAHAQISSRVVTTSPTILTNSANIPIVKCTFRNTPMVDGITDISNATQYPPTNITGTDLETVLQQLKQEYPDLFTDSITESVLQPDGTITTNTYVPVPWVATDTDTNTSPLTQTQPITQPYTDAQTHTTIDPSIAEQILTQTTGDVDNPPPTTPPTTGDGDSPTSIMPIGNASSLWSVYNPTQAQVDSFGAWLWSSNFIEQIKKLFADPMQAIIGIHKVFCTPITGENRNIVCGYIDSGVSSKIVTNQYVSIDCGTISLREYFGSVMDYAPYTKVKIYLPFIGIVPLDVADIMRSSISVKYKVDVFTGACLAQVEVIRDNAGGTLYTYSGSAIVSYPLSSGSYAGIISGVLSAVTGIATSALTGGNPIPAIMGAGSAVMSSHTDVSHHGSFTGCAGAMGIKIPYLIITRPQVITPSQSGEYFGYSAPFITKIGTCDGYIKCKETHINIPNASVEENNEINNLLITGIYMDSMYSGNEITPPTTNIIPLNISANGTYTKTGEIEGYNPIYVNVPNTYSSSDENKVVYNGELVSQTPYPNTITANGTYNTTQYNSITVDVSGGSGGISIPQSLKDFAIYINKNISASINPNNDAVTIEPLEYQNNIYNNAIIQSLNMVLLGDFSQGGETTNNVLLDDFTNYSTIVLQGIYQKNRTSGYNTSMAYINVVTNTAYWAGMKDKNNSYTCNVTFTDSTHCDLSGNKQVIIYGIV